MRTLEEILDLVKTGAKKPEAWDKRDFARLCQYFPVNQWEFFGLKLDANAEVPETKMYTLETVMAELAEDLDFAFDKSLDKHGFSSGSMFSTIKMWLWVLDDPLQNFSDDDYAQYGLPLYKAVAAKYNLPNPIGDDTGTEPKYSVYG